VLEEEVDLLQVHKAAAVLEIENHAIGYLTQTTDRGLKMLVRNLTFCEDHRCR
jgi:hypothetical protein